MAKPGLRKIVWMRGGVAGEQETCHNRQLAPNRKLLFIALTLWLFAIFACADGGPPKWFTHKNLRRPAKPT